jgi:endonuclease/exonuclease/phosphatase family metal-dependent hydrolase
MGKLAVFKCISFMLLIISLLLAVFTVCGLLGGFFDPASSTAMAMLVYVLPFLIVGNVLTLIYWLARRRWIWLAIPGVALLCSIHYVGSIYQLGLFNKTSNDAGIRIASYNVAAFGREITGFKAQDILAEMKRQSVDIFCIQEYVDRSGNHYNSERYKEYFISMVNGRADMAICSRYPILRSGTIDFGEATNNSAMWADIDINGKQIRVFNAHLETTGFNRVLHNQAKLIAKGGGMEDNALIKAIYGGYTHGMAVRARQADLLASEISQSEIPVIVCGDFNDVPYSYVYRKVLGDLVDGFRECGRGFMYTMSGAKKARIDYIFHDSSMKGEKYYRLDMSYSDHYPVFMKIIL